MCGICGKLDFGGRVDAGLLARMCATMVHRGPDSQGLLVEGGIGLGMRRLAIIDVAGGDQPIFNEDRSLAVVANGEIYNHAELRDELRVRGHRFRTQSDVEVIVHLYEEHGAQLVQRLRGMFAFALWDSRARRLLLARDRVGKKPLFWSRKGSRFWFASELCALLEDAEIDRSVDYEAVRQYLSLQYVPHPLSAFAAIKKLPPASTLSVTEEDVRLETYWSLDYEPKQTGRSLPDIEEELRGRLREATRIRLMSEVPLGAFLSGGVDSSAVVAFMAEEMSEPVKTFSIGFPEDEFNELRHARRIADRYATDHHEFVVEPHALELMPKLARHYGEPFADSSAIPSFYLAELTGRHVTVALNGDGGDESFSGYHRYATDHKVNHLDWLPQPVKRLVSLARLVPPSAGADDVRTKANRLGRLLGMSPAERYALRMTMFDRVWQQRLLSPAFAAELDDVNPDRFILDSWAESSAADIVDVMLDADVKTYLPADLLVKMDIATMAHSVEARSPFLDHELMEFAASLPVEAKRMGADGKRVLRSALRGIVPDEILDRRKMGFGVPLTHWFRGELRDLPAEVLLDSRSLDRGYFRRGAIERLIREHHEGRAEHAARLWVLLQLELWHREVVEAPARTALSAAGAHR